MRAPTQSNVHAASRSNARGVMMAVLFAFACAAAIAQDRFTLNFVNTEIDAVVKAIGQFTGKTFIVDPRVKGTITLSVEQPLTRAQALSALTGALRMQGYATVESNGIVRVVPEADAKLQGGAVQTGRGANGARGDELVTQVFRLNYESATNLIQVLRPLIAPNNTINAYAGNNTIVVTDYAENVRRIARIIAAIDSPAGGDIEVVRLQHAIASDLALLLGRMLDTSAQGGDPGQRVTVLAEPTSNSLLIRSASPARSASLRNLIAKLDQSSATPGNIHVVYLKNAEATRLARTLLGVGGQASPAGMPGAPSFQPQQTMPAQPMASQQPGGSSAMSAQQLPPSQGAPQPVSGHIAGAQIQADPTTNTLIITASETVYQQLRAVIDKLDVRRAQVFIESLIVEVSGNQASEFGIQWMTGLGSNDGQSRAFGGTNFGGAGQNIVGAIQNPASLGNGLNIGVIRGQITIPGVGTVTNLPFLARALEQNSRANILSTPNILTLDNEEAKIVVGQNVPFITGQFLNPAASGGSGGAAVNPFQTIERRDVGLTLRVRPQISEGGVIKLVIYQEVSSVDTSQANTSGIITNKRSIDTNVLVDNGTIVVLGGLVQDTVGDTVQKVPLLGDIPLLGNLFRYNSRTHQKTNLMVFLRPIVVRDEKAASDLTFGRYDQMRSLEEKTGPEWHWLLPDYERPVMPPREDATPASPATAAPSPVAPTPAPAATESAAPVSPAPAATPPAVSAPADTGKPGAEKDSGGSAFPATPSSP